MGSSPPGWSLVKDMKSFSIIAVNLIIFFVLSMSGCSEDIPEIVQADCSINMYSWYVDEEGCAIITAVKGDIPDDNVGEILTVPAEIDGHRVKAIGGFCMGNYPPKIILPEGLEIICSEAFSECEIEEVYIPSTVNLIEDSAFSYCPELKKISVSDENSSYQSINGVLYSKDGSELLCCPAGVFCAEEFYYVKDDVEIIRPGAFSGGQCNHINIIFPDSVEKITGGSFYFYDSVIDSISLPNNVCIEDTVFFYMDTEIMIRGFPQKIGENAFKEGTVIYFNVGAGDEAFHVYHTREDLIDFLFQTYGFLISTD